MGAKLLVIGIDAASWTVIDKHIKKLPTFSELIKNKDFTKKKLILDQKPFSAPCWTSMFTGLTEEEHKHSDFIQNNNLVKRTDIDFDFTWDILHDLGFKVKALNVPFVVPPFSFNCNFKTPGMGVPSNREEWDEEIKQVTNKSLEILQENLDLFITCFVTLDKLQHFHWGEDIVLEYYEKIDNSISKLIPLGDNIIIISDHGFCSFGEAKVQTLPKVTSTGRELKGDHHEESVLITNLDKEINNLRDIHYSILEQLNE